MGPIIDLSHVSCGLVPAMVEHLARTPEDEVVFRIRSGIKAEILNGFGSGGAWDMVFRHGLGHDEVRFTRRGGGRDPRLGLLDY